MVGIHTEAMAPVLCISLMSTLAESMITEGCDGNSLTLTGEPGGSTHFPTAQRSAASGGRQLGGY